MSCLDEIEAADIPSNGLLGKVEAMSILEMVGDIGCQETYGASGADDDAILQVKHNPIGLHGLRGIYVLNIGNSCQ